MRWLVLLALLLPWCEAGQFTVVSTAAINWFSALSQARSPTTHLATISSAAEQADIHSLLGTAYAGKRLAIGVGNTDVAGEDCWIWADGPERAFLALGGADCPYNTTLAYSNFNPAVVPPSANCGAITGSVSDWVKMDCFGAVFDGYVLETEPQADTSGFFPVEFNGGFYEVVPFYLPADGASIYASSVTYQNNPGHFCELHDPE
eukprot:m.239246 g.239246  ORF g.239246 m.239246 type:complete len:205 (-) comp54366_c3_seq6:3386-4000(-)